jgi:hypothetical protein
MFYIQHVAHLNIYDPARGLRDGLVVGFTTTYAIRAYHH